MVRRSLLTLRMLPALHLVALLVVASTVGFGVHGASGRELVSIDSFLEQLSIGTAQEGGTVEVAPTPIPPADGARSLYLAVGHGRTPEGEIDLGAEDPVSGQSEIGAGQVVVDAMVEVLAQDARVAVEAESGDHPNVMGSVDRINAGGYDDCITIHHEWIHAPPGAFAHWHPSSPDAGALSDRLVDAITDLGVPFRSDWHRPRGSLRFVRATECRAVLVEVGRIGDHDEAALRDIGQAMARAYLSDPVLDAS